MTVRRRRFPKAFTLIELLVVIAVIALLIGILLPALGKARETGRRAVCSNGSRQATVAMNVYANDERDWMPVFPVPSTDDKKYLNHQGEFGGIAGLFSLWQIGNNRLASGDGYTGRPGDTEQTAAYRDGNTKPLLANYVQGYGFLYCPSDKEDYWFGKTLQSGKQVTGGILMKPQPPKTQRDIVSYNISYLYVAGFKTDESALVKPAPLWGDETLCQDYSTDAWYFNQNAASLLTVGSKAKGYYGTRDNHGADGAVFAHTDGHVEFIKGNVNMVDRLFGKEGVDAVQDGTDGQPLRSWTVQTID